VTNTAGSALVALGTNMPHAGLAGPALLWAALKRMQTAGLNLRRCSAVWETAPWPPSDQAAFFNAVVELDAQERSPQSLFDELRTIELAFGRERRERWGPRTLDLDLLDLEGKVGTFGAVTLPHKRLHERAFVLRPLVEIAPDWRHPILGKTATELLAALPPGQTAVRVGEFSLD
jgi:2-amino-4-hydroxy-6-hydroxymethyldihydropteridine diphosphokinase